MATHVVPSAIVVEVLRGDNYKNWRACMKSYFKAQGLWDIISPANEFQAAALINPMGSLPGYDAAPINPMVSLPGNAAALHAPINPMVSLPGNAAALHAPINPMVFLPRNAAALHAIQISCAPHILSKIRNIDSAQEAWALLEDWLRPRREYLQGNLEPIINDPILLELHKYAHEGKWDAMKNILDKRHDLNLIYQQSLPTFRTALHVATMAGHVNIVEELLKLMSKESLEQKDIFGNTALFYAAIVGSTKMAEIMIKKNISLIFIENNEGYLPLVQACISNHKDMTRYLYRVILDAGLASEENSKHGSLILQASIDRQMLDIAFDLLRRFPRLATERDAKYNSNALILLSTRPDAFYSCERLVFWKRWIYSCMCVEPVSASDEIQSQNGMKNTMPQVLSRLIGLATHLLKFLGFKQIYDSKLFHNQCLKLLRIICGHLETVDVENYRANGVYKAFRIAVENGIVEIIAELIKVDSDLMMAKDKKSRNLFLSSIAYRQEKIFNLFYGVDAFKADAISSATDNYGNTMLHLAGKLSSSSRLDGIAGAALQMQRELQWYKEVENVLNPKVKEHENGFGEKPGEIFTRDHKHLMIEGEKWMKDTATSCTVVGALIITIMFTAAFTVPGGNIQDVGLPIFLHDKAFSTFIISDAISLFASSTSVLMFLGILTSRYSEQDFLRSLPTKLTIGLSTLFISIATMMVAFCAALIILLDGKLHIVMPIVFLAGIPVTLFMLLQFPLLVEIFLSTYGLGIFDRKTKCWY